MECTHCVEKHKDPRLSGAFLNVREFGAVGDGLSDDTQAIQSALDALTERDVGLLLIPAGTYRVSSTLVYPGDVTIVGSGAQSTVVDYIGAGFTFAPKTPQVRTYNVRFSDLQINTSPPTSAGGIDCQNVSLIRCDNVAVFGKGSAEGGVGIRIDGTAGGGGAFYGDFFHSRCLSIGTGWRIENGANDTHLYGCRVTACGVGVDIADSNHVVVDVCAIESGGTGVRVQSTSTALADGCLIRGCRFEGNVLNVEVSWPQLNVRDLRVVDNHHVTGVPFSGVIESLRPCINDTGTPLGQLHVESAMGTGPCFTFVARTAGASAMRVRQANHGSGSPNVLEISGGRSTSKAISILEWNGTTDVERAYLTVGGSLSVDNQTLHGSAGLTLSHPAAKIRLGTSVAGNAGVVFDKGAANNQSWGVWESLSTYQWIGQHDSAENWNILDSTAQVVFQIQRAGGFVRVVRGVRLGPPDGPLIQQGLGSPEGVVVAEVGSLYVRRDGGPGTTLWVKESGAGAVGWVAK